MLGIKKIASSGTIMLALTMSIFMLNNDTHAGPLWTVYGSYRSQIVTVENDTVKAVWDRKKEAGDGKYLPIFGPAYDSKRKVLYFLESSPSTAYLREYSLKDKKSKVLWEADRQNVRQVIFYPHSFADSMSYDESTQTLYWAGRAPGRNGPTTFYAFDTNKPKRPPKELTNIKIASGRQIGQSAVYKGNLYVSSINEGIYRFPLKGNDGGIWISSKGLAKGRARGPSIDTSTNKMYFSVGLDVFETDLADKPKASKLFSLPKTFYTIWGISKPVGKDKIYITAKESGRGGHLVVKDLKDLEGGVTQTYYGRTSSASKNLIYVED